jgi:TRAP transporter TAXI family solute receptor
MSSIPRKYLIGLVLGFFLLIVLALHFLVPAPPRNIVIAAGGKTGQYYAMANELKKEFEKNDINVQVLVTNGSIENLELLSDKTKKVDIAFVQSGSADNNTYPDIQSLAGIFYEPFWVVYRAASFAHEPSTIEELRKKRISVGAQGSGTRRLAEKILELDQIAIDQPNFYSLGTEESLKRLRAGDLDVMLMSVNNHSDIVQRIFKDPSLKLMSIDKAYGYPLRIPGLQVLQLKRATLDVLNDNPSHDILLLSSTAELVAKKDIHPAIVSLLVDVLGDEVSKADVLNPEKTFPNSTHLSFEQNDDAHKTLVQGPSFFHRYLPFWFAVWVDRLIRIVIPLLAVLIPLMNLLPSILTYQAKLKFASIYKELKDLELKMKQVKFDEQQITKQLINLTERTRNLKVSQFNNKDIYDLLSHIGDVQRRIKETRSGQINS